MFVETTRAMTLPLFRWCRNCIIFLWGSSRPHPFSDMSSVSRPNSSKFEQQLVVTCASFHEMLHVFDNKLTILGAHVFTPLSVLSIVSE